MKKASLLIALFFCAFASWRENSSAAKPHPDQTARLPNVIVIYTDDHGWPDIGAQGIYDDLKTPHIDALAASGVRATKGYSTAPQCVPSRAGLLIGKHQSRFGVESNGTDLAGFNAEQTIAERLKAAGYATGQIGKWHLGPNEEIPTHGFDDVYSKNANRPCEANYTLKGETIPMQMVNDDLYHLDACSQAALAFIRRHTNKEASAAPHPFFLYLAYRAPHVPLDAPQKYLDRFPGKMPERRRQALAMLSSMDDGIGAIVQELKDRNLTENTLIFYIGDNGAPLKIHKLDAPGGGPGWDGSLNAPMNGEKGMLAEGGIRVPFLVSFPGTIPPHQVYDHPLSSLDVAATAVALAGLPADGTLDGTNIIPHLSGDDATPPHDTLTWRWIAQAAIREGKWKLLRGGKREYLYNLDTDPGETTNLLAQNPEVAENLRTQLDAWSQELTPPGLETKSMSEVWENYYDFYLDGKPASPLRAKFVPEDETAQPKSQGWTPRNATLEVRDGALHVTMTKNAKQHPFIVHSEFQLKSPLTVHLRLKSPADGHAGVAWRTKDQKDFPKDQIVPFTPITSPDWHDLKATVKADQPIIHFRLLLPGGESTIESIEFRDAQGAALETWNFKN
jgi:arylsulfatase A-like enzyme